MIETEIRSVLVPAFLVWHLVQICLPVVVKLRDLYGSYSENGKSLTCTEEKILKLINWMYYIVVVVGGESQCLANVWKFIYVINTAKGLVFIPSQTFAFGSCCCPPNGILGGVSARETGSCTAKSEQFHQRASGAEIKDVCYIQREKENTEQH